ncbi:MAG: histidinol-phosphate transaminase, partial [Dehalococcoidales bacterium]|nr:histidinol-phosphate transaminase [Dehalococcoidales bacterium]
MSLRPRPEIENLKACPHGGLNYAELEASGLTSEAVLDFSVCTNPFPPPPRVRKMLHTAAIGQYPDSETTEIRGRLSERLAVPRDNIIVGSGTTELIRLIALAYFQPGDRILLFQPTYGEYEMASLITSAEPVKQKLKAEDNFTPRLAETIELIRRHHPRAAFICNPNNPTSRYLSRQEVETVRDALGDALLIIDEAYVNFTLGSWSSIDLISTSNVVILRSMTKDYALAGLRLGYAIARREIIHSLRQVCPPWNVNVMAQKMGAAV